MSNTSSCAPRRALPRGLLRRSYQRYHGCSVHCSRQSRLHHRRPTTGGGGEELLSLCDEFGLSFVTLLTPSLDPRARITLLTVHASTLAPILSKTPEILDHLLSGVALLLSVAAPPFVLIFLAPVVAVVINLVIHRIQRTQA